MLSVLSRAGQLSGKAGLQCGGKRRNQFLHRFVVIGLPLLPAPDYSGPAEIITVSADHMNMQLAHHVADGGHIDLVRLEVASDKAAHEADLSQDEQLIFSGEVAEFRFAALRNQYEPRNQRVVHQEDQAAAHFPQDAAVRGKPRIELKIVHGIDPFLLLGTMHMDAAGECRSAETMVPRLYRRAAPQSNGFQGRPLRAGAADCCAMLV